MAAVIVVDVDVVFLSVNVLFSIVLIGFLVIDARLLFFSSSLFSSIFSCAGILFFSFSLLASCLST